MKWFYDDLSSFLSSLLFLFKENSLIDWFFDLFRYWLLLLFKENSLIDSISLFNNWFYDDLLSFLFIILLINQLIEIIEYILINLNFFNIPIHLFSFLSSLLFLFKENSLIDWFIDLI